LNIDSYVAQVRNRVSYFSPSRLALDAQSSPKKSKFYNLAEYKIIQEEF